MSAPIEGITNTGITGITNTIPKITPPTWGTQEEKAAGLDEIKDSPFGSIFGSLIQNVKDTDAEFTQNQYLLATGQLDNPVQMGISAYKAEVALDLLIQMRNRALEAYNELKNMSV
ncbi:MAG: flagellar hook-basal body complex protein FliE [Oscillospiraceae bacterium]|nr:flagellar hook-basal body complex protein FliE [Oscillospiraceae bacterium]MDE7171269.1 flagellar hook-basal body complex protein FliE [Oscillospiraceae bacterium]